MRIRYQAFIGPLDEVGLRLTLRSIMDKYHKQPKTEPNDTEALQIELREMDAEFMDTEEGHYG